MLDRIGDWGQNCRHKVMIWTIVIESIELKCTAMIVYRMGIITKEEERKYIQFIVFYIGLIIAHAIHSNNYQVRNCRHSVI